MLAKYFKKKKVLITGHTGFKGSWLSLWMYSMGAKVLGISNKIVTKPSNFKILDLQSKINSKFIDIRNYKQLKKNILNFKPNFIFHLAAQPLVKKSYQFPKLTWETNTLGTINILETLKNYKNKVVVVIITSDKVYKNKEIKRGYKETDTLGGFDPYSASKSSADIASQSYINSYLKKKKNIKIAIARAGNVIGGGDWAEDRLVPDCIKQWSKNKKIFLRNPYSTRPWQHVLDILYGYILLSINLGKKKIINGEVFNFGPGLEKKNKVLDIVKEMSLHWKNAKWKLGTKKIFLESNLLHLNSAKAIKLLKWKCKFNLKKTIHFTIDWYKMYYYNPNKIFTYSLNQIKEYLIFTKK